MRLFIAIQLSEDMRREARRVQDQFRRQGVEGNYTKEENLHLTLAFVGDFPEPDVILYVLEAIPLEPFELKLNGIGSFGDLWWLGLGRSDPLEAYVKRLRHALSEAAIPFDRKRFSPHITLIRRAVSGAGRLPSAHVDPIAMRVEHVSLMRSDRGKNGMIYTEIVC